MKLVLAEKPSVAMSLSKVIGANQRGDGYMEGNGYLVSWCVGHLVELSQPEAYDEKYAKWRYDDLPILPDHWRYQVSASTKKQFGILKKLMQRKDVESLICATDAGREGELIFRLVYHQCGCKKPVERLWISSMEDSAIREGFQKLRPGTEYDALYEAALCRERADWIVGINATRLFSCLYGQTLNVGRVMTPTLAMVVMRDAAIRAFKPEPFYSAELKFRDFQAGGERMKEKAEAEKLVAECCQAGSAIITKVEQKEKSEKPPALFDLTSLQREANRQLGFTAQQTLDYTQALYEKKLVTYPRTDSRYLTDDMAPLVPELVSVIQQSFQIQPDEPAPVNAAQVINSKKVTDHHAIIPTKTAAGYDISSLPSGEQAILTMLAVRLICAVGTPCRYAETIVEAECAGQKFRTKGKTVTDMGWRQYAEYDLWNDRMNRYVKRGSKGIALLDMRGEQPKLRYVFDVADTGERKNSRPVQLWKMNAEHEQPIIRALDTAFDVSAGAGSLENHIMEAAERLARDYWEENRRQISDIVADSYLEGYDELNIGASFKRAAAVSIAYSVFTRTVGNADDYFEHEDFLDIFDFNTQAAANVLGTAVSEMSSQIFREIERTIRTYERDKQAERSQNYDGAELHEERRLPDSGHPVVGAGTEAPGQVREDAQSVSAGEQHAAVQSPDPDREAVPAPVGDTKRT